MSKSILSIIFIMVLFSVDAESVIKNPPEGKVYTFKKDNGMAREIEVHFPKEHKSSKQPVPGIIMFHGGGWSGGSRKQFRYLCHYFANRGLVAATVSYKLADKKAKKAKKKEKSFKRVCISDAKSAIRWYKQHADELGIDPQRIIAGGGSAGGHICLLATTNPGLNDPQDPEKYDTSVVAYLLFNPALYVGDANDSEVDFLKHLKADLPPAIVFFGDKDGWLKGWTPAYDKIKSLGIKSVDFWIAEGQAHSFFKQQPWADLTLIESDRFLKKLGLIDGEPTIADPKTGEKMVKKQ